MKKLVAILITTATVTGLMNGCTSKTNIACACSSEQITQAAESYQDTESNQTAESNQAAIMSDEFVENTDVSVLLFPWSQPHQVPDLHDVNLILEDYLAGEISPVLEQTDPNQGTIMAVEITMPKGTSREHVNVMFRNNPKESYADFQIEAYRGSVENIIKPYSLKVQFPDTAQYTPVIGAFDVAIDPNDEGSYTSSFNNDSRRIQMVGTGNWEAGDGFRGEGIEFFEDCGYVDIALPERSVVIQLSYIYADDSTPTKSYLFYYVDSPASLE